MNLRHITIYLCICIIVASCGKRKATITIVPDCAKNHLQREHIYGKVRTITDSMFYLSTASDSILNKELYHTTHYKYSADGWLNEVIKLNSAGDTISTRIIHYDEQAKMVKDELFNAAHVCMEHTNYENDTRGFRVREQQFTHDSLVRTILYLNDAFGNLTELTLQTQLFTLKRKYTNNDLGLVVRVDEFDPDGKLFKYVTMEYDNYGDLVNHQVFRQDGQLLEYTHTQYADDGRLLKTIYENKLTQGIEVREFSHYDLLNNWTQSTRKIGGRPFFSISRNITYY